MTEWRDISTAPKDGTDVLLWGRAAGEISGPSNSPDHFLGAGYFSGEGDFEGYDWELAGGDYYAVWGKPSHWMPLPEGPSDE